MGRYKIDNPQNERIMLRMDRKLRNQLERQARSENVAIAVIARKALQKFIDEELKLKNKSHTNQVK